MGQKITRRNWLIGASAATGSVMLNKNASAQQLMNMGMPVSKENPIRFSSNENPYGINPNALKVMFEAHNKAHMYNFGMRPKLEKVIADIENLPPECVASGAGSTEFLMATGVMVGMEKGDVVAPNPTYRFAINYAQRFGSKIITVPVGEDMAIDLNAIRKAITHDTGLVYLCNPNNPIPTIIEKNTLREFCLEISKKTTILIDEAYYEYVDNDSFSTMADLVKDNPNIIICRTASKIHAFANIRIGFAFAHPDTMVKLKRVAAMTASFPAMMGAITSYQDKEFQKFVLEKNKQSLNIAYQMFEDLGLDYIKSNANFTYFNAGRDPGPIRDRLLDAGISLGRDFKPFTNWIRISTAKPEEMEYFTEIYKREFG